MGPDASDLIAHYNDGETAARQAVILRVTAAGLAIWPEGSAASPLATWDYERLERLDEAFAGAPLRLAERGRAARLTLPEGRLPDQLLTLAPQLAPKRPRAGRTALLWGGSFVGALGVLALVILAMPFFARQVVPLIPKSWEQALGEQVIDQVVELFSLGRDERAAFCVAPAGRTVLQGLTDRLAAGAESPFAFDVRVLDLPLVNAVALPGGPIILFRGLIEQAGGPDEVAGVLAHEMSHVVQRHAMESLVETLGLSFLFGVMLGDVGSGLLVASGEALVALSYSRETENEADDGAIVLLQAGGVSTQGLADFFDRLALLPDEAEAIISFVSTHPSSARRSEKFAALARPLPPALDDDDWRALQEICAEKSP